MEKIIAYISQGVIGEEEGASELERPAYCIYRTPVLDGEYFVPSEPFTHKLELIAQVVHVNDYAPLSRQVKVVD